LENNPVDIWPSIRDELTQWIRIVLSNPWTPVVQDANTPHDFVLATDASLTGYGAVLFEECSGKIWEVAGKWATRGAPKKINEMEARAVSEAIRACADIIRGGHLLLLVDNTSTRATLHRGSAHAYLLNAAIGEAVSGLLPRQSCKVAYIATNANPADAPSRGKHAEEQLASALGPVGRRLASSALRVAVPCNVSLLVQ